MLDASERAGVTDLRLRLREAGYDPLACEGKIPPMREWEKKTGANADEITMWAVAWPGAHNTGILCKRTPTIDIDIANPEAAAAVEALAREFFEEGGYTPVRIGKAPRRAILLRTDEPFKKLVVNLVAPNNTTEKIEVLADGQQVIVFGVHPETLKPYEWFGGSPDKIARAELPYVREDDLRRFLDAAAELLVNEHGYTRAPERPKTKTDGGDHDGGADWQYLCDCIRAGQELHDSLRDLAAKLVASGMSAGAAVNFLRAQLESSAAPRDPRWQERYDDVPRLVESARTRPQEHPGNAAGGELAEWDAGDDPGTITPRHWLLGNQFCRAFISSIVAAGGTGKSALRLLQFISLALGRPLCGQHIFRRCRVLLISLEDDTDELHRRIKAVLDHFNIPRSELKGWLFCATPKLAKLALMQNRERVLGPLGQYIKDAVERRKPDLISLDPFVKTHSLEENDSGDMDFVANLLTCIAIDYNVAVDCPHHVHKGTMTPGDADSGRGSTGIRDAGRLNYTLCTMSADEAATFGISGEDRRQYVRLDPAKVNIAPRSAKAEWFRLVGVNIGNSTPEYPNGDTVQVAEPWAPPDAWTGTTSLGLNAILTEIDRGMTDEDGNPTGRRYSNAPAAKDRAAWPVVLRHYPGKPEGACREIIHAWLTSGLLYVEDYDDPKQRRPQQGLLVDDKKRPG